MLWLAPTGLSSYTIFCWDVRAGFEFDVDDARFLIALQYHCLTTCGQYVVGECSFCVTMTRAFCKVPRQQRMLLSIRHNQLER